MIDPSTRRKIGDILLKVHPEAFQIDPDQRRVFVNLPGARAVAVVDITSRTQVAAWPLDQGGHFPMAVDRVRGQIILIFRGSSELAIAAFH